MQIGPGKCTIWGSFEPASHEGSGEERAAFRERVPYFVHLNSDLGEMGSIVERGEPKADESSFSLTDDVPRRGELDSKGWGC